MFETNIRYVGGFLAAYALTADKVKIFLHLNIFFYFTIE